MAYPDTTHIANEYNALLEELRKEYNEGHMPGYHSFKTRFRSHDLDLLMRKINGSPFFIGEARRYGALIEVNVRWDKLMKHFTNN
ncbi:MAG: hypothetical protein IJ646_08450 [Clostridia bacterium]|nr:hypothetical protein [Clostridia bacterium]